MLIRFIQCNIFKKIELRIKQKTHLQTAKNKQDGIKSLTTK